MNEIINVNYDGDKPTVSARELYDKIGSTERFSSWFERQLQYGFEIEKDYSNPKKVLRVQYEGKREVQREVDDYDLTIEAAKEICIVQKNEKAREIRKYLIKLDEAWNDPQQVLSRALKIAEANISSLEQHNSFLIEENKRMKPKEVFADAVEVSNTCILIGELAKILKQNGIGIGQNRLFEWLRNNEYLIRRKGIDYNMPTQKSMELGLFEIKERTINNPDGSVRITKTVLVTGKGQQYFINKFLNNEERSA